MFIQEYMQITCSHACKHRGRGGGDLNPLYLFFFCFMCYRACRYVKEHRNHWVQDPVITFVRIAVLLISRGAIPQTVHKSSQLVYSLISRHIYKPLYIGFVHRVHIISG